MRYMFISCHCRRWYIWISVVIWVLIALLIALEMLAAPAWLGIVAVSLAMAGLVSGTCKDCHGKRRFFM